MKVIVPPIKSQGIKTKLVPWLMELAPKVKGKWVEPFLGTGVVAFNSGFKKAILNDTNPHIINFYKEIQKKEITAPLMKKYLTNEGKLLSEADNNGYEHYLKVPSRFNSGEFSPYDFIFLSRAGFNGMMRFGSKYCDPPYYGRHVDYYNGWTEQDEELLFKQLSETKAKFILSTWHHNDWRENEMISKFWNKFNIVTKDHFYHNGGNIENRRTVVEALVCNFDTTHFEQHNHGQKKK